MRIVLRSETESLEIETTIRSNIDDLKNIYSNITGISPWFLRLSLKGVPLEGNILLIQIPSHVKLYEGDEITVDVNKTPKAIKQYNAYLRSKGLRQWTMPPPLETLLEKADKKNEGLKNMVEELKARRRKLSVYSDEPEDDVKNEEEGKSKEEETLDKEEGKVEDMDIEKPKKLKKKKSFALPKLKLFKKEVGGGSKPKSFKKRAKKIESDMKKAYKELPHAYIDSPLIYLNTRVNGVEVKAAIDSGAEKSVMTLECCQKVGLAKLIDQRFSGTATGMGITLILGRVHHTTLELFEGERKVSTPFHFSVLSSGSTEFLIGMDILRKLKARLDLKKMFIELGSGAKFNFLKYEEIPPKKDMQHLEIDPFKGLAAIFPEAFPGYRRGG
eukprot:snap_masked-scaffold_41-processed-gene-2.44-mRNA-1 protein AED:1.00 eAED:1.00 QI:0/-1/0/0/-1/1/1/0/385